MLRYKFYILSIILCSFFLLFFLTVHKAQAEPSLTITSPNGGESFIAGQMLTITWNQIEFDKLDIYICWETNCYPHHLIAHYISIEGSTGSYNWSIPYDFPIRNDYKIRIFGYRIGIESKEDFSDAVFSIIDDPAKKPVINNIFPTRVVPGIDTVEIYGHDFRDNKLYRNEVYFNNIKAAEIKLWTDTKIIVLVPDAVNDTTQTSDTITVFIKVRSYENVYGPNIYRIPLAVNDRYYYFQKDYLELINAPDAWKITAGNSNIVVAVIDSGIYITHPDLFTNIWENTDDIAGNGIDDDNNGYIDDRFGWNFIDNTYYKTVRGSHGTMIAGIIGAIGNNNIGIAGINWKVRLMNLIACDDVSNMCDPKAIDKAIRYAVDNGADVINISTTSDYSLFYDDSINYAFNKGVVIVASAGMGINRGTGQNLDIALQSPVCNGQSIEAIIGVGAVDKNGIRTTTSNYGERCVDIYAPGLNIISTAVPSNSLSNLCLIESGTSYSTAFVSGAVALLKSKYPLMPNIEIRNRIVRNSNGNVLDIYKILSEPYTPNPSPLPSPSPITSPQPTTTPSPTPSPSPLPSPSFRPRLEDYGLKDGDTVNSAGSSDPDIYIVNNWGYKRLFLNPVIFKFYGHLGGFSKVKTVTSTVRDIFITSGIFRNCEANDPKVYGVEITGEDTGTLHWINMTGPQAAQEDPDFFKKVFCINNNEFNWYSKSPIHYTFLSQIPVYSR